MKTLIYNDTNILMLLDTNCKATLEANIGSNKSMQVEDSFILANYEIVNGNVTERITKNSIELYQEKQAAFANIVITTSKGNTFKGDEKSQTRMISKITEMQILDLSTTEWKCINEVITISLDELKEALALSSKALSDIVLGVK